MRTAQRSKGEGKMKKEELAARAVDVLWQKYRDKSQHEMLKISEDEIEKILNDLRKTFGCDASADEIRREFGRQWTMKTDLKLFSGNGPYL